MKRNILVKKSFIGIMATAALVVSLVCGHSLMAAERVDTTKTVKLTAQINEADGSVFANEYEGTLTVEIYKIAKMDSTGGLALTDKFKDSGIDLSILENKPTVDAVKTNIVEKAKAVAQNTTKDAEIILTRTKADTSDAIVMTGNSVELEEGAGLYLYIPLDTMDDKYEYTFTPYVILAPTSDYVAFGQGSDEWNYNPTFSLKSTAKERFGSVIISKKLDQYNSAFNTASFVYSVVGTIEGEVVFDNVYTIDFDRAGTKTKQIDNIPAQAQVTVTEVYDGASYEAVGEKTVTGIIIDPDKAIPTASFENTYDGKMITGGISAVNEFVEDDGEQFWIDESGQRVKQEVRVR